MPRLRRRARAADDLGEHCASRLRGRARRAQAAGNGSSTTSAAAGPPATATHAPGLGLAAHERQRDRAEAGRDGACCRGARRAARRGAAPRPGLRRLRTGAGRAGGGWACPCSSRRATVSWPDVAALGEAHGALVEAGLLGDHGLVEVDAVARAAMLDAQALGRLLADRHGAARAQRRLRALGVAGLAEQVDARRRCAPRARPRRRARAAAFACSASPSCSAPATLAERGPISDSSAALERALVQLHVEADLEAADHVEQRLQRHALGVEQQLRGPALRGSSPTARMRRSPSILPLCVRNAA